MSETESLSYLFSDKELKQLALYLRKNADSLPKALEPLSDFAESYVYGKMTIGEAEAFFEKACL
ncbi:MULTISPECIES: hypothetical protein [unclassified Treponema]|uniref:hypothetical protein n=1 Tax=unclassified Treponema TaxID=2638727 RepID=UPI0020A2D040|nr:MULTISPECIES: hypothetical protein [unclassified Treponema]UTC68090.1 hypothetical protein E4O06_05470 [Treponema sp. OMZ 789]UTC70812.1 hypothetical protein E4O01_05615 [Treponema sp. OMZ 790]UTC73552.1 hypothetical protein E4O02_05810 [Treponema sp. OMZ 791]